jgi:hypothetical protein
MCHFALRIHENGRFYGQSGGIDGVVHEKGCFHG